MSWLGRFLFKCKFYHFKRIFTLAATQPKEKKGKKKKKRRTMVAAKEPTIIGIPLATPKTCKLRMKGKNSDPLAWLCKIHGYWGYVYQFIE